MQQLAGIPGTMHDFDKLERIALKAQERAQRLEQAREQDMKEARAMNFAEDEWLKKAKLAREEANSIKAETPLGSRVPYSQLQKEKEVIKQRLRKNEEEMAQVKQRATQTKDRGGDREHQPSARRHPRRPVRQTQTSALEKELRQQQSEYSQARQAERARSSSKREEREKDQEMKYEIAKYRAARHQLIEQGGVQQQQQQQRGGLSMPRR
ncbi:hypothetical protein T484DRAFT_2964638 [Baffinella frigidus]|nr:hypothetical protein T484DRAFT_2964638 [Cryptophyta sp. CCMP2293]